MTPDKTTSAFDELKEFHENFVAKLIRLSNESGHDITPQISYSIYGRVHVYGLLGDGRTLMRGHIDSLSGKPVDWLVTFNEGYADMKIRKPLELAAYVHGSLEERFNAGDQSVKEIVVLSLYMRRDKLSIIFDKKTAKKIRETPDFSGFMTVQDYDRICWSDWQGYGGKP